ncbi:M16 family metallopeptidase [Aestuariispira ectoiniformans]|uniref:M16 family metallopeptidase n=1 Tax=Aestuariispira ectoiniformans TaxID=2775080 RepID=UPI00223B40E3|nr:pitrilysin family protein [Aestuariispira ectoiniformans]
MTRILAALALVVTFFSAPVAYAVDVQEVISPGGIKAWLIEDSSLPVTAIEFTFREHGAALDPKGKEGLADLTSSLIDEGAGDLDSQAFQGALHDKSMRLSFYAGQDGFGGSFYSLNRYRDEGLDMLHLALTNPRFDAEPVDRIRSQVLVGLKQRQTDPNFIAHKTLMAQLFPDHRYGRSTDGTPESVSAITVDDMRDFTRRAFTRKSLIVAVVGAVTADELGPMLDRVFGDLPEGKPVVDTAKTDPVLSGGLTVVDMDVPQSAINFAQAGPDRSDPDFYAATVLNYILGGGGFSSRLTDEIREKRGLVYSVYSSLYPRDEASLWFGGAATRNAKAKETVTVLRDQWREVAEKGVTAEEVKNAKTYLTGSYPLSFTNTSHIASILVGIQREDLGIDYINRRNNLIEAVTPGDVNRVAKKFLTPDKLSIVVVGRPDGLSTDGPS